LSELRYLAADPDKWKKPVYDLCSWCNYTIYYYYYYYTPKSSVIPAIRMPLRSDYHSCFVFRRSWLVFS
jgi:hypothetical protein